MADQSATFPSAARDAAVALAGAQSTAIITRIGLLEYICANNVDPSVAGQAAIIGARCTTVDGTKCWIKFGAGDTQWSPRHSVSGTFGSNVATWDTTALIADLACDTLGPFELDVSGVLSTDVVVVKLRVNEATVQNNYCQRVYTTILQTATDPATAGPPKSKDKVATLFEAGASTASKWFHLHIDFRFPYSGAHQWVMYSQANFDFGSAANPYGDQSVTLSRYNDLPSPEIHSIGVDFGAGTAGAATRATLRRY